MIFMVPVLATGNACLLLVRPDPALW
jgi:hypothetical protein